MATPGKATFLFTIQDDRGFKARVGINSYYPDLTAAVIHLNTLVADVGTVGTAVQAATNAKVVSTGFAIHWDEAQEPTSETGTYQLVEQGAHLLFGDGTTLRQQLVIPAPVDAMFLTTTQDNLVVVDPASSQVTGLQTAMAPFSSAAGGVVFSQFFGGQLRSQKPRRRRVLQGA